VNEKFRNEEVPVKEKETEGRRTMFMTAFDFDYLRNKYNAEKNPTMKDATIEYHLMMESEISSKTTLRTL
jgi:hypothetical protein